MPKFKILDVAPTDSFYDVRYELIGKDVIGEIDYVGINGYVGLKIDPVYVSEGVCSCLYAVKVAEFKETQNFKDKVVQFPDIKSMSDKFFDVEIPAETCLLDVAFTSLCDHISCYECYFSFGTFQSLRELEIDYSITEWEYLKNIRSRCKV